MQQERSCSMLPDFRKAKPPVLFICDGQTDGYEFQYVISMTVCQISVCP